MPLPKPRKQESKDRFINRCMGNKEMKREYKRKDQRLAVCNNLYRK